MRVLWFSWRDIKNPAAGGAELFSYEIMRRLVKKDYKMNLVTSKFPNGSENENIEGINIVRKGGKFTVYEKARAYYKKHKDE